MEPVNSNFIPKGWDRKEIKRKSGLSKGKIDVYYYSPKGKVYRSKKEILQYIEENKKLTLKIDNFNFKPLLNNSQFTIPLNETKESNPISDSSMI